MKQQAWTIRAWASELLRYADDEAVIEKWHGVIDAAERRGQRRGRLIGVFIGAVLATVGVLMTAGGVLLGARC